MKFDFAIIGAGSGGLTVAAAAAQFGRKVVLFEKGEMGGDCLNYGCVPSKALIAAAKRAAVARDSARYGIGLPEPEIDFPKVMAHVHSAIAAIAPNDSQERFEKLGVKVVRAEAKFVDGATVEAAGERFQARRFVVATGSTAAIPPIPGLAETPYFTNESLFHNDVLPKHLIVIGGGPIGMEMAQAHRRLGAEVTVLQASDALDREDQELATVVVEKMKKEGVTIRARINIAKVRKTAKGIEVELNDQTVVKGSHLLVAAGRRPNLDGLGLDKAGIAFTPQGITVDKSLKSTNRKVYAIGDVAGLGQFTHLAGYHAGLVIRNALFGLGINAHAAIIPRVTYTDPELASVGLSEADARKIHGDDIKVLRWPFHENDRAVAEADAAGFVKVITGKKGAILGAGIVGTMAGELLHPWILAMSRKLPIKAMIDMVPPYPTRGEANRRAAITQYAGITDSPWVRRVIGVVSSFP